MFVSYIRRHSISTLYIRNHRRNYRRTVYDYGIYGVAYAIPFRFGEIRVKNSLYYGKYFKSNIYKEDTYMIMIGLMVILVGVVIVAIGAKKN